MDRIRNITTLILTLLVVGALAVGCNSGTEEPDAPAPSGGADSAAAAAAKPADVPPEDIDPSRFPDLAQGVEAAVPDNYPSDLPVYPGAVPAQGRGTSGDEGDMSAVQLLTNDSPGRAYDFYKGELEAGGWAIDKAENTGESSAISVIKDGCKATFMFVPSATGTGTDIFTISACDGEM